jgi:hypothetical protein
VSYDDWKCTPPWDDGPQPRECSGCGSFDGCEENCPGPFVCPGCHAVDEPCLPGCIDAEMAEERRSGMQSDGFYDDEDEDDIDF